MSAPLKEWFSPKDIAGFKLRGIPISQRGVELLVERERWDSRADDYGRPLSRARQGRGGGREFHWSLLPSDARLELVRRGIVCERVTNPDAANDAQQTPSERWAAASSAARERAKKRHRIVAEVLALVDGGITQDHAITMVLRTQDAARSSVFNWMARVSGEPKSDWLPLLLDKARCGRDKDEIPAELWSFYESWWLRQSEPTYADTYRRTRTEAARLGISIIPSAKTFIRRAEEIPPEIVALKRGGDETARLLVPAIERSVADWRALEIVNADGHKWDVGVRFPDGTKGRVITVAIQDIYSRKFLAWRHGRGESANVVRLAFMDLFRTWGFPDKVLTDNGRAFASKWITGGAKSRYRYSIKDDDPLGLLPRFGIDVIWALPKRGSSKPIERGFRDFAQNIAKHAAFDGAWLGNSVANKPENYGSRLIDFDDFVKVIDREIAEHNSRVGRETEMAKARGLSFDQVFAESYAETPIRRASELQLHECMLSSERVRGHRETGAITFMGNRYWKPGMARLAGKQMIIRYDPENLHSEVHVYDATGPLLLTAPIWEKAGFLTEDHGRARMKIERDLVKNTRKDAELRGLLSAQELAHRAALAASDGEDIPPPKVVRMVRSRGVTAAAVAFEAAPLVEPEFMDRFSAAMERRHLRLIEDE